MTCSSCRYPTVNFNDLNLHDTLTVGADFTRNLTVNLDADTDVNSVTATNYTGNLLVTVGNEGIDAATSGEINTLTGGTGTDTLRITADTSTTLLSLPMISITNFETFEFVEDDSSADATTGFISHDNNIADGASLTIDATALSGAATIGVAAETNGSATVNTGTGADTVTLNQIKVIQSQLALAMTPSLLVRSVDCGRHYFWWSWH